MKPSGGERRKRNRSAKAASKEYKLSFQLRGGVTEVMPFKLLDLHERGCGLEISGSIESGTVVTLVGDFLNQGAGQELRVTGTVAWCRLKTFRSYRAGIEFLEPFQPPGSAKQKPESNAPAIEDDYYEILQLSPNADLETIHRVYRILAQRFHPDNQETGNQVMFCRVVEAYRVLTEPEQRAAYDTMHQRFHRLRWKIFDQASAIQGADAEKAKRQGVLSLLYAKRMGSPESGNCSLPEMEELLGVPREHLEFTMWYLKESGAVGRADNGKFTITIKGVDMVESSGGLSGARLRPELMLTDGASASAA